jgi:hyaluronoglucosaminidase
VLTPNGKELYILGAKEVTPVTTAPLTASPSLKITVTAAVISPNSNTAYLMQPGNLAVVVVATGTNARDKTIGTGQFVPEALALSPNGQDLYVVGAPDAALGGGPDDVLLVYDTATGALSRTVSLGAHADNGFVVALTPSGGEAYVLGYGQLATQGWVVPVNTSTGSSGALIHGGFNASAIVAAPSGKWVYVLDNGVPPGGATPRYTGAVVPIDVATGKAGKAIPVVAYAEMMTTP